MADAVDCRFCPECVSSHNAFLPPLTSDLEPYSPYIERIDLSSCPCSAGGIWPRYWRHVPLHSRWRSNSDVTPGNRGNLPRRSGNPISHSLTLSLALSLSFPLSFSLPFSCSVLLSLPLSEMFARLENLFTVHRSA